MAQNPAHGAITPKVAGTLRMNGQNELTASSNRRRNSFPQPYENFMTLRFGEVRPFFKSHGLAADTQTLSNSHVLYSYTLQSPMLSNLKMYKDYFYIPMKAILPHSWDAWNTTPVQGEDVPDDVYCNLNFATLVNALYNATSTLLDPESTTMTLDVCQSIVKASVLFCNILSVDSLAMQLRIFNTACIDYSDNNSLLYYDNWREANLGSNIDLNNIGDTTFVFRDVYDSSVGDYSIRKFNVVSDKAFHIQAFRDMVDYVIRHPDFSLMNSAGTAAAGAADLLKLSTFFFNVYMKGFKVDYLPQSVPIDISPLIAYQMTGAQFYVNDAIDSIYTSFDWMQEMWSLFYEISMSAGSAVDRDEFFYSYNGHLVEYDVFSYHILSLFVNYLNNASVDQSRISINFFFNLFMPFYSLRYGDYFTGSRVSPLAVGDVKAPVVANEVSAVDMTHATLWQRFLQKINKVGPTPWLQQAAVYGRFPSSVDEMPRFISRTVCDVGKQEIENTANNQGLLQTNLRSNEGQYGFNVDIDEDSIVLGLVSFDCPRIYVNNTDRTAFIKDRYDKFQPDFQNVGDQAILLPEVNVLKATPGASSDDSTDYGQRVFAWTLRNTEYKQRVNIASGGFVGNTILPSWAFTEDAKNVLNINPDFIRNHPSEFDRFYKSLSHYMPAGYFHFIVQFHNNVECIRAMEDEPTILF